MEDYQKRYVDEYRQLSDRIDKLADIIKRHRNGELDFELNCPVDLLTRQLGIMMSYKDALKLRASFENIDLEGDK
jgi:hypothetical protein